MKRPKDDFLSAVYDTTVAVRDMVFYRALDCVGLPYKLYTSYFFAEDVERLLLDGRYIEYSEKADVFLENSGRTRLHAEPALMPGKWRIGIEKIPTGIQTDKTPHIKWLNTRFAYDSVEALLTEFERTGFAGLVSRNMRGTPEITEQVSARIIYDLHYGNHDLHPTHVAYALRMGLAQLWPRPAFEPENPPEQPEQPEKPRAYSKVVSLLERKREIGEGSSAKKNRHPPRKR